MKKTKEELAKRRAYHRQKRFDQPLSDADAAVIRVLPKEGEGINTFVQTAWSVKILTAKLADQGADHDKVSASIRSMLHRELIKKVELSPRTSGPGYQITKRGEVFLREYESQRES